MKSTSTTAYEGYIDQGTVIKNKSTSVTVGTTFKITVLLPMISNALFYTVDDNTLYTVVAQQIKLRARIFKRLWSPEIDSKE
jgi:hypothetical protein